MARILVAEDSPEIRVVLRRIVQLDGHECVDVGDGQAALDRCAAESFDLILSDLRMPRLDGLALLKELRRRGRAVPVVILTAYADMNTALEAVRAGAFDYLAKPLSVEDLRTTIRRALETDAEKGEGTPDVSPDQWSLVGRSPAIVAVFKKMARLIDSDAPVFLFGETGTGKEVVARILHSQGPRKSGPFVPVNCAALPEPLLEAELFGHVRGAFTGADADRPGLIESAHKGTLFLDEVGELPPPLQGKLLRFQENREVRRVGSTASRAADVRILCATNRDLDAMVRSGAFRQDLFYRINVHAIHLPSLRDRVGDVPLLFRHFLGRACGRTGRSVPKVDRDVLPRLEGHPWPGNVRELQYAVERALANMTGNRLRADDLEMSPDPARPVELRTLQEVERDHIRAVLRHCGENRSEAARILGIDRKTLLRKLKDA
ncbi:MAG: sigma-54-dependent Fis family transcriptional regulator [Planctomycetes bacterium]|nr:sigma-54-dependent Fis family transcriptional regulator [Planctomycetota bacterium]